MSRGHQKQTGLLVNLAKLEAIVFKPLGSMERGMMARFGLSEEEAREAVQRSRSRGGRKHGTTTRKWWSQSERMKAYRRRG